MKIICINGQGGVGKDLFVAYCAKETGGIYNFSMVDGIKKIAEEIGWKGGKTLKDRRFLSDLKDLTSRYNDFPFTNTFNKVKTIVLNYVSSEELIIFIHARESQDIDRWVKEYGARTLLIRRPEVEGKYNNHADDEVFLMEYDYVINNSGTLEDLKDMARHFITEIKKEDWYSGETAIRSFKDRNALREEAMVKLP